MGKRTALASQVDEQRKSIRTDGYPMSIGELANMYRDGELDLHPEFQRFFRWSPSQKSRLIESLLLGIPIPSIFVYQRPDGVWDVVDGLQRLSTIFEAMGILRDEVDEPVAPLELCATKYLPALEGKVWGTNEKDPKGLGGDLQRLIKRSKLDVKIVLRESDVDTKFELFQRLNTGGSPLSGQELRNCLVLMATDDGLKWLKRLADHQPFQNCLALSDRAAEEQYDMELVVRFLSLRTYDANEAKKIGDLGPFLDERIVDLLRSNEFDRADEEEAFYSTFNALDAALGDSSFRRYDAAKGRFLGGFLVSAFEVLALGVGYHCPNRPGSFPDLDRSAKELWQDQEFLNAIGSGVRAERRLRVTLPLGRRLMAP